MSNYKKIIEDIYLVYLNKRNMLNDQLMSLLGKQGKYISHYYFDDKIVINFNTTTRKSTILNDALNIDEYEEQSQSVCIELQNPKLKEIYDVLKELEKEYEVYKKSYNEFVEKLRDRLEYIYKQRLKLVKELLKKENITIGYISLNRDSIQIKIYERFPVPFGIRESVHYATIYNNEEDIEKLEYGRELYQLEEEKREIKKYLREEDSDNNEYF